MGVGRKDDREEGWLFLPPPVLPSAAVCFPTFTTGKGENGSVGGEVFLPFFCREAKESSHGTSYGLEENFDSGEEESGRRKKAGVSTRGEETSSYRECTKA